MLPIHDENESETIPYVNNCLIAINIIVFCIQVHLFGASIFFGVTDDCYCLVPSRFLQHFDAAEALTLLTSMFSHAGLAHLIGNLWVLYLFGDNVEDKIGHRNYLLFYLGCGVIAAMAHIISDPASSIGCLGASGAIAGVMAAYLILFPSVPVKTWICWFWCINIPAWLIIGGWFAIQLLATAVLDSADHVAYFAHIGGFAAGIAFIQLFSIRRSSFQYGEEAIDVGRGNQFKLPGKETRGFTSALGTCLILAAVGYAIHEYTMQTRHGAAIAQSRPPSPTHVQPKTDGSKHLNGNHAVGVSTQHNSHAHHKLVVSRKTSTPQSKAKHEPSQPN
jgi:membrane associated rhomboid family serine protease